MFTHCLSCHGPFDRCGPLERFGLGRRVAYDADRGRLWAICRLCRRWTLAPMEERWEALEELERITAKGARGPDAARLLTQTDNIALLEAGALTIVRVGRTDRAEEAWWRYGMELHRPRHEVDRRSVGASLTLGAAMLGGAVRASLRREAAKSLADTRRWLRFGDVAWRGHRTCVACGHVFRSLSFFDRKVLVLTPSPDEDRVPLVSRRCPRCKNALEGGLHLDDRQSERTLRRVLAFEHYGGAPLERVRIAMGLIERAGQPSQLAGTLARYGRHLGDLPPTASIAMDIAANEAAERKLLALEASVIERYWREEEELAAIVDGELTPSGALDRLRLRAIAEL